MAIIRTVTGQDLKDAMKDCGRDYFCMGSCEYIIHYYEDYENIELDPIAIACEWNEETVEDVVCNYSYMESFEDVDINDIDSVIDALTFYTTATRVTDDNGLEKILYITF